jgi:hypothetical protein
MKGFCLLLLLGLILVVVLVFCCCLLVSPSPPAEEGLTGRSLLRAVEWRENKDGARAVRDMIRLQDDRLDVKHGSCQSHLLKQALGS